MLFSRRFISRKALRVQYNYNFHCNLQVVKEALLYTLAQELKDVFTEKCRNAWALTFDILAEAMAAGMVSSWRKAV